MPPSFTAVLIAASSSLDTCAWRVRPPVTDPVLARRRFASSAVRPINTAFQARIAEDLGDGYRTARRRTSRSSARTGT
jgi:hypothetical protein